MTVDIHPDAIEALVQGLHGATFNLLGPHPAGKGKVSIRAFRPNVQSMHLIDQSSGKRHQMMRWREEGFFEITLPGSADTLRYLLEVKTHDGRTITTADAYAYGPLLTDFDLHLLTEGRHLESYSKLGAHLYEIDGVKGTHFAVWAPNAQRVSVTGDFNAWDARVHVMRDCHTGGIWELFIPGVDEGAVYRYDIHSRFNNYRVDKSDPYAFFSELRPRNASVVANIDGYVWHDSAWLQKRAAQSALTGPMLIYEVHPGSWRQHPDGSWLSYRELADALVAYVKDMKYTHIELMPVAEHPLDASWGYQVTGYFAPTSRYGSPKDFMYLVDLCHQNDIGVILDWVPAHFPKDGHGLSYFDGTHLYEHADPRKGAHPDWGTYIFNFGRNEVRNFLLSNALFWLKHYHIDGLRVDAVSSMLYLDFSRNQGEWIPNQYGGNENLEAIGFLREMNEIVHRECPGAVTIAEESTAWPMVSRPLYVGGLGFTLKWNMGWMHDTLEYIKLDPIYRRFHHNKITFSLFYAFSENFILSLSHDEVVHMKGSLIYKMAGDWWQKFAGLRLLFGYQVTHPGKKLFFMGQEFGQWREWSETRSLDWDLLQFDTHRSLQTWVRDLNTFYQNQPALYQHDFDPSGFRWIDANDADQSVFSYIRFADDPADFVVVVCNFTPVVRSVYRIGVPEGGYYAEVLNSDSTHYGGSNVGNYGGVYAEPISTQGFPYSLSLTLPPLALLAFKLTRAPEAQAPPAAQETAPAKARKPRKKKS